MAHTHSYLDTHESDPPLPVTPVDPQPGDVAAVSISAPPWPSADDPPPVETETGDLAHPAHALANQLKDGLHLKSERCPRDDYAIAPLLNGEAIFRHSGWARQRQQTWDSLQRVDPMAMSNYRFANCGSAAWVQSTPGGEQARCVCNCCHHRLCVPCQRAVGRTIQANIRTHLGRRKARFVTLTLRHSDTPLSAQVDRLFSCWSALRRRTDMKPLFAGGVAVIELKVSDKDGRWHVHLHILTEGQWVDVRELSLAWHAITGDSSIVDVRAVGDSERAIAYVTKYISKPVDATLYANAARLDEFVTDMHGRKTSATFGSWRGLKLKARPKDDLVWVNRMSLMELSRLCKAGDEEALALLATLRHQVEQTPREDASPTPPPSP